MGNENAAPVEESAPVDSPPAVTEEPAVEVPPVVAADDKAEAKKVEAVRKLKLKIEGKEEEVDEADAIRDAQKWRASQKRFDELASEKKKFAVERQAAQEKEQHLQAVLQGLKDPRMLRQIIEATGTNPTDVLSQLAEELTAEAAMSPQERAYRDRERQLEEREQRIQQDEQARKAAQEQAQRQAFENVVADKIDEVVTKLGFDEKNKPSQLTVQRIAMRLMTYLDAGTPINHVNADDLMGELDNEYAAEHNMLWAKLPAEKLYKRLGDAKVRELAEYVSKQVPKGPPSPTSKLPGTVPNNKAAPDGPQSIEEYNALMERYRLELATQER